MDFSKILTDYHYKTELHAHSFPVSSCGDFSAEEVVKVYSAAGVDSLVLTNHLSPHNCEEGVEHYLSDYYKALEAAAGKINVILGVEMRFSENSNDYLVYGVSPEDIPHFIELIPYGIENFYKEVKNERNVIIQAHPFRKNIVLAPEDSIDGIESFNLHPGHNSRVGIGARYAKLCGKFVTAGTDFHHAGHQALALMRTKSEMKDSYDIAEAIKSRDVVFDCSGHIVIPYLY